MFPFFQVYLLLYKFLFTASARLFVLCFIHFIFLMFPLCLKKFQPEIKFMMKVLLFAFLLFKADREKNKAHFSKRVSLIWAWKAKFFCRNRTKSPICNALENYSIHLQYLIIVEEYTKQPLPFLD